MTAYRTRVVGDPEVGHEIVDMFNLHVITFSDPADAQVVLEHLNRRPPIAGYSIEEPLVVGSYSLVDPAGEWVVQHKSRAALERLLEHLNRFIRPT